jgi:hypothetical protein
MDPTHPPEDVALERWLRASRPEPRVGFVDELEHRLIVRKQPARRKSQRPLLAGLAAALGTAAAVLVLALAGVGPFTQGGDGVNARDNCRFVTATRVESVPRHVSGPNSQPVVRYQKRTVHRRVRRCR